jgi:hypothetical protein
MPLTRREVPFERFGLAFNPDSTLLVCFERPPEPAVWRQGTETGVHLFQVADLTHVGSFKAHTHDRIADLLTFVDHRTLLVQCGSSKTCLARMYDTSTGVVTDIPQLPAGYQESIVLSPTFEFVATKSREKRIELGHEVDQFLVKLWPLLPTSQSDMPDTEPGS